MLGLLVAIFEGGGVTDLAGEDQGEWTRSAPRGPTERAAAGTGEQGGQAPSRWPPVWASSGLRALGLQSTADRCPLSCTPGAVLTHRAAHFCLASLFTTVTLAALPHSHPTGQLPRVLVSHFKETGPRPGALFLFRFPPNTCSSSITAFMTSSDPVSVLSFPAQ